MELEYSKYIPKLIDFWKNNIRDNCHKINITNEKLGSEFIFLLKESEKGNLLCWLNSKESYLAYIILTFYISRMNYKKKNLYKNDYKSILFLEMGMENYIDKLDLEELITILSPYMYSEDINHLFLVKNIIVSRSRVNDNKIKILLFRLDNLISVLKKYGRFPERNNDLNRLSTEDEIDYLDILDN